MDSKVEKLLKCVQDQKKLHPGIIALCAKIKNEQNLTKTDVYYVFYQLVSKQKKRVEKKMGRVQLNSHTLMLLETYIQMVDNRKGTLHKYFLKQKNRRLDLGPPCPPGGKSVKRF